MERLVRFDLGYRNKAARAIWSIVWLLMFRPSPVPLHGWRRFLLRLFGAKIARTAVIYPSARIWAPWNLSMGEGSCLSHFVDCYCVTQVSLGKHSTVSQYAHLCAASHDYSDQAMPLVVAPIAIEDHAWVTACVFVGPGVRIGEGAVVGAQAGVFRDVAPWSVVGGNPARFIKHRERIEVPR